MFSTVPLPCNGKIGNELMCDLYLAPCYTLLIVFITIAWRPLSSIEKISMWNLTASSQIITTEMEWLPLTLTFCFRSFKTETRPHQACLITWRNYRNIKRWISKSWHAHTAGTTLQQHSTRPTCVGMEPESWCSPTVLLRVILMHSASPPWSVQMPHF